MKRASREAGREANEEEQRSYRREEGKGWEGWRVGVLEGGGL